MSHSAAFFDVDGTLVGRNIVHQFLFIRRRMLSWPVRGLWTGLFLTKAPYYFLLDKVSRTRLNVVFYQNYAGLKSRAVHGHVQACFEKVIRPHPEEWCRDTIAAVLSPRQKQRPGNIPPPPGSEDGGGQKSLHENFPQTLRVEIVEDFIQVERMMRAKGNNNCLFVGGGLQFEPELTTEPFA